MPVVRHEAAHRSVVLSIPAAQDYLGGYSRRALYQLTGRGEIDRIKVGGRAMVTRASLDAYLARQVAAAHESRRLARGAVQ